jgi:uncharacterized protein YyaL (SSP411 family)
VNAFELLNKSLELFYDNSKNVIYQQSRNSSLPIRTSENKDYSKPSSTSLAISVLFKLGKIYEAKNLIELARRLIRNNFKEAFDYPFGAGKFLSALLNEIVSPKELILVEGCDNSQFLSFKKFLLQSIHPCQIILYKRKSSPFQFSYLESKTPLNSKLSLYICENFTCRKPVIDLNVLNK